MIMQCETGLQDDQVSLLRRAAPGIMEPDVRNFSEVSVVRRF